MTRWSLLIAVFAVAAFAVPAARGNRGVAVAATPTPVALGYDEINRAVLNPATPPPPGSFSADYQAIVATMTPGGGAATPAPRHHGGLGAMLGAVMGGNPPEEAAGGDDAMAHAGAMMAMMKTGHLMRYTYYKGWLRTDDPMAQTATIEKCDQHQFIMLNLAKKTYTVTSTQPPCPTAMNPMMPPGRPRTVHEDPGTADLTIKATGQNLGPMTIDGIATTGWDRTLSMVTTNATGSCQNGDVSMALLQYISSIVVPRPYCPLPHTMGSPSEMVSVQGGCKPTLHGQMQGMEMDEHGRLVMYRRISMGAGAGDNGQPRMMMVTERGNVKWTSGAAADALFAIPPDFTQAS